MKNVLLVAVNILGAGLASVVALGASGVAFNCGKEVLLKTAKWSLRR